MYATNFQRKVKFTARTARRIPLNYLLYLPAGAERRHSKRWPLMLFLHGAGERGTELAFVGRHGPPKLVAEGKRFPFILVSPQCPPDQRWNEDALLALLNEVTARYPVDKTRVYLTGLSMGGYASWTLAVNHPERFAAVAPVCGGGNRIDILLAHGPRRAALQSLPFRAFHGAKDDIVPVSESRRTLAALLEIGCKKLRLTVYSNVGHDSYTRAYGDARLYEWFLRQRRSPVSSALKVGR